MIHALWNQIEHAGLEHIGPRINVSAACFFRFWLFQKATHPPVVCRFDYAVHARIFHRSEYDRGYSFALIVLANDGFQIKIGQNVPVEDHRGLANQLFRKLVCARSAHRLRLDHVFQLYADVRSIAELLLNLLRLIRKGKRDIGDPGAAQRVDLIEQERSIANRHDRFRRVNGQRAQPCAFSSSQNQCLHD